MPTASLKSLGYLPVATASLLPAEVLNCDLYIRWPGRPFAELYRGASCPFWNADLNQLREDGVDHLYVRLEDAEAYRNYVCQHVLHDRNIPQQARMRALREVTRVTFQDALDANDCGQMVGVATAFGNDLARMVSEQSIAFRELFSTLEHDYYTFTHVCNVSMYCVVLAHRLRICDEGSLPELAAGALLHDIGKRHIPAQVLNKPGKLADDEWEMVRTDLSWPQLMMVYQHHERLNGSGYPAGIPGDEMHPWARVCAVVDVFDALTCHRSYRRPVPASEVCKYLNKYAGLLFDAEAVACWTSHVARALR
jgi:HD-GYP domain-containing protein (c-di-GMP phosphodiesterase class II)